ncbi:hypothetical protein SISSUDRAFT_1054545 [Sistotremastrum suecicum HHB10207 ss-3]|uniref:Uncharacterized protein n=1 Tax=Sistotremastrum suecicum HHB10207 ss-3 TaxID=1314776 RepID=A0A165YFH2_9AGAM|nr:hypothetical protein SISSUDRAFT_1054545 [Sistotremastrum suecicum HHB10207 ss-3]
MDPFASSSSTSAAAAGGWGAASSSTGCPIITSSSTALSGSPTFTGEGEEGERGTGTLGKIRRKLSMKSLLRPSKSRLREVEEEDFGNFNFAESYHGDYGDEGRGGEEELGLNVDVDVDRSPSLTSSLTSSSEGSATASSPASRQMSTKDSLTLRWHTIQLRVAFFVYRKRQTISRKFSLDKLPGGRGRRGTEGEIARPVPVWVS